MQEGEIAAERILVVDDEGENLLFLADGVLRPRGYEVRTATGGQEGLELALAERPDLLVVSATLPGLSGLEMMAELATAAVDLPVILTAAQASAEAAVRAFQLGAKGYLVQPYAAEDVAGAVERALAEGRLRREQARWRQDAQARRHFEIRVRGLHSLCTIGRAMMGLDQVEEVAQVAVDAAVHLVGCEVGELFLISPMDQRVRKRAVRGPLDAQARMVRADDVDSQVERAIEAGDMLAEEWLDPESGETGARLVVPLRRAETVLGALAVVAPPGHPPGDDDRYHLSVLAGFVAEAVNNARAITDLHVRLADLQMVSDLTAQASRLPATAVDDVQQWIAELEQVTERAKALVAALTSG